MLLIISNSSDATVEFALPSFERRGVRFSRLDTDRYPAEVLMTVSGDSRTLRLPDRPLDLNDVRAVWWRRPVPPALPRPDAAVARWVSEEARLALDGALRTLGDVYWVNHPDNNRRAEDKVGVMRRATAIGLTVPPWLVTNDAERAQDFAAVHGRVVAKPLTAGRIDENRTLWTTLIRDPRHLGTVGPEPYFLQRFVDRVLDVRVTIIGSELFAVAIDTTDEPAAKADWRRAASNAKYRATSSPDRLGSSALNWYAIWAVVRSN